MIDNVIEGRTQGAHPERRAPGLAKQRWWVLEIPWEDRRFAEKAGAQWLPEHRQFAYRGTALPPALADYDSKPYSIARWIEDTLNQSMRVTAVRPRALTPRPEQLQAVRTVLRALHAGYGGAAILDGTGRGKSLAVAETIRRLPASHTRTVLLVAPKGAIPAWRHTIADSEADLPPAERKRWLLISYGATKGLLSSDRPDLGKTARTRNKNLVRLGELRFDIDTVIVDESQRIMNLNSQQAQVVVRYQDQARASIWLSATPGYTPTHFAYMARAIGAKSGQAAAPSRPLGAVTSNAYLNAWGEFLERQGASIQWSKIKNLRTWKWVPETDAARRRDTTLIHDLLFSGSVPLAICRPSPPTPREALPQELTPAARRLYDAAWLEYRQEVGLPRWRMRGGRRVLERNPTGAAAALRFRQKASYLRAPMTAEQVAEWVRGGDQVFVSAFFSESSAAIAEHLADRKIASVIVDGTLASDEQARRIRAFQLGEVPVIISSIDSAINLHAGELLLPERVLSSLARRQTAIHDPNYSGIVATQIEGRCNRIDHAGNDTTSTCWWMFAEDTVEETMVRTALTRIADIADLTGIDPIDPEEVLATAATNDPSAVLPVGGLSAI
ncbi:DEAD/DEAH box helicase [Rhodococcus hoagii]|nr:DEAD/DEAH box helicase [Prescottella equi]NKS71735.1 DEAD/DEAH box helicase [Prescottella equi]